jgi:hypothetical protein
MTFKFYTENMEKTDHVENTGLNERIMLKQMQEKQGATLCTELM